MPIHDWTRVGVGTYHDFHQGWTIELSRELNRRVLPPGYYSMVEMPGAGSSDEDERATYARKANRLSVRGHDGKVVAIIEVVSPGNKDSVDHFGAFVGKLAEFVTAGVHVVVVDLFPPTPRDPDGVDRAIWDRLGGDPFEPRPAGKNLTVAAIEVNDPRTAYSDPVAVGDTLPDVPLFLAPGWYVNLPLEQTYAASWAVTPDPIREMFDRPAT